MMQRSSDHVFKQQKSWKHHVDILALFIFFLFKWW